MTIFAQRFDESETSSASGQSAQDIAAQDAADDAILAAVDDRWRRGDVVIPPMQFTPLDDDD